MELAARYKTINYMIVNTQDCWCYDGSCNEAGGKSYVCFKELQHVHSVKTAVKTQLSNTSDCSGTGVS